MDDNNLKEVCAFLTRRISFWQGAAYAMNPNIKLTDIEAQMLKDIAEGKDLSKYFGDKPAK